MAGKPDEEQLRLATDRGDILVTSDKRIKNREHERKALLESGVSVIEVSFPDSFSLWDRFKMLVNHWEKAEALMLMVAGQEYVVIRPRSVKTLVDERRQRGRRK